MIAPLFTFRSLAESWQKVASSERNRLFGSLLTEEEQDGAWTWLRYREGLRREIELSDLAFDRGMPLPARGERRKQSQPASGPGSSWSPPDDDDIFRSIPPPVYIEALTGEPVPAGGGTICCPIPDHEDLHPSCRVYAEPDRGFHCFACNRGGTAIDLASYLTGIPPRGEGYWQLRRYIAERLLGREGDR